MTGARQRTIVGSGPARKPLPFGTAAEKREAIERAIKHCEFWRSATPFDASTNAWSSLGMPSSDIPTAEWLPDEVVDASLVRLRELLQDMPPRAER